MRLLLGGYSHLAPALCFVVMEPTTAVSYTARQRNPLVTHYKHEPTSMAEVRTMATERLVIPGMVKNSIVVPQNDARLPAGAQVDSHCPNRRDASHAGGNGPV